MTTDEGKNIWQEGSPKGKILVVDDELSIRELFTDTFGIEGYTVLVAENAEEALSRLAGEAIDLIFLDLRLFGMNGIELCRQIRKKSHIPVIIAMTGWSALFDIEECREAGFDDYFTKPLQPASLLKVVTDAFEKIDRWRRRGRSPLR